MDLVDFVDVVVLTVVSDCGTGGNVVVVVVVVQIMDGVLVIIVINAVVLGGIVFASGFDAMYILISFKRFEWKSNWASAATHTSDRFSFIAKRAFQK